MGIRPKGEGDRDMSRQLGKEEDAAEEGERKPFEEAPSGGFSLGCVALELLAFCCFASLATVFGLRLRLLARLSRLESEDSGSSSSEIGSGVFFFLVVERVIGAK